MIPPVIYKLIIICLNKLSSIKLILKLKYTINNYLYKHIIVYRIVRLVWDKVSKRKKIMFN
ncbi:hypothetical protein SEROH_32030 [Clostridioides difficile]